MAEDRKPRGDIPLSDEERLRLQALADKRGKALDVMSNTIHKQDEARRNIVDKMR